LFNILLRLFNLASSFNQIHESKGVKFITDAAVKEFKGENGKVFINKNVSLIQSSKIDIRWTVFC